MKAPLVIGFDVDEVLSDFTGAFVKQANKTLGLNLKDVQWPEWDIAVSLGLTKEQERLVWQDILNSNDFNVLLGECPRNPGLARHINRLFLERKITPYFITARAEHAAEATPVQRQTARWLERHGFAHPTVLVTFNKGPLAAALKLDAFIDDKFANCLEVKQACPDAQVFMPKYTYNTKYVGMCDSAGIHVIEDAYDALEILGL